MRLKHVDNLTF